jgi:ribonucleoside-diphosphate reductase alpha chain
MRIKPSGIRSARVHKASINGLTLYVTASNYDDGRLGEVFVSAGKQGSLIKGLLESLSTTISKMLQYGISPQDVAMMYRGQRYEPNGFVSDHPYIKQVDSVSDLISKIIEIEMGDFTHCQVKPEGYQPPISQVALHSIPAYTEVDYLPGEVCPDCRSNKMVRNGTCRVCTECGSTTGCS